MSNPREARTSTRRAGWARVLLGLAVLALPAACGAGDADVDVDEEVDDELAAPFEQDRITLTDGDRDVDLRVLVADTSPLRRQGLRGWTALPADTGMLFVFDDDVDSRFTMSGTPLPLSIAFADADGRIHTLLDMEPCPEDPCPTYGPDEPFRFALEVEQGLFDDRGVDEGWRLELPSGHRSPSA